MRKTLAGAILASLLSGSAAAQILTIQVDKTTAKVSPTLYGLMTEEINYSYDGGMYAEMVRNRTFRSDWSGILYWLVVEKGSAKARTRTDRETGPSEALKTSMRLEVSQADAQNPAGVLNEGYWGMALRPDTTYRGSFYAKTDSSAPLAVTARLVNSDSGKTVASATVSGVGSSWARHEFTLKTGSIPSSSHHHLELLVEHPVTLWLDLVSLFPPTYHDRPNGNRADLMEKLAAMHPAFLRFPGGNYLEGDHIADRFQWKKTIGPLVDRSGHQGPWRYYSTDGMGLLEFLEWCEDLNMQPLLAVYAGYSLQQEHVNPGPDLEPYVSDALDELEYVTGGVDTKWGAVRAANGHPKPFPLKYVEVGNEDQFDRSESYDGRYSQFHRAIKAKYPELQIIATAPVKSIQPDVIDDHFYRRAPEFFSDVAHYDKTDRNGPKIFVGEWATREGAPTPNFGAALGDAAWMTGMERNSDIVIMSCYAPLLVNVNPGGMQWESDLIGYNALSSYGSPSYYAQAMFASNVGDAVLDSKFEGAPARFFYSVTRSTQNHRLFVKLVNASSSPVTVDLRLEGQAAVKSGKLITLSANDTQSTNTIDQPTKVVPVESALRGLSNQLHHSMPAFAIQVLQIDLK
ncbi:MAG TPA: alpha-L-arabinofuranosidase C-terminal domain-containing protein [Bryobacteraceae bacterium]|nr:alpha-L-arabinofuranosidase C-terminal domain-containing protein [Bryobacteraceae bacterium]